MASEPDVLEIKITSEGGPEDAAGPASDASVAGVRPSDHEAIRAVAAGIAIEGVKSIAGRLKDVLSEAAKAIVPDVDAAKRLGDVRQQMAALHESARATRSALNDRNVSSDDFLEDLRRRRSERDAARPAPVRPKAEPAVPTPAAPQSLGDVSEGLDSLRQQAKSDRKHLADPNVSADDFLDAMRKRRAARAAANAAPATARGAASAVSQAASVGAGAAARAGAAGATGAAGAAGGGAAGAAGAAGAGAAGAAGAGAVAAIAAVAAPVAAVAVVAAAGLGALAAATDRLIDRFDSLVGRYENYDPSVAGASAQRDAIRELGNLRRASMLGDDLADFIRARGRGEQAMADLSAKFDFVMLRLAVPLMEAAVALLERLAAAADKVDMDKFADAAGFATGEAIRLALMQTFGVGAGNLLFTFLQKQLAKLREEEQGLDPMADKFFDDFFGDGKGNPGMTVPFGAAPPVLPPIPVPPVFPDL